MLIIEAWRTRRTVAPADADSSPAVSISLIALLCRRRAAIEAYLLPLLYHKFWTLPVDGRDGPMKHDDMLPASHDERWGWLCTRFRCVEMTLIFTTRADMMLFAPANAASTAAPASTSPCILAENYFISDVIFLWLWAVKGYWRLGIKAKRNVMLQS